MGRGERTGSWRCRQTALPGAFNRCYGGSPSDLAGGARGAWGELPAASRRSVDRIDTEVGVNEARWIPFDEAPVDEGTGLVCGYLEFDQPASNPLLDALPEVVIARSDTSPWDQHLPGLLRILVDESTSSLRGTQVTLDRLCDVVFVLLVRDHLRRNTASGRGASLADARIGRSLDAIHNGLDQEWTVEIMAGLAAMSRASFSARFRDLLGSTPFSHGFLYS